MKVVVSNPARVLFEKDADKVFLPLKSGEVSVLPGHTPMVGVLKEGDIRCFSAEGEDSIHISKGIVMVKADKVEVLSRH